MREYKEHWFRKRPLRTQENVFKALDIVYEDEVLDNDLVENEKILLSFKI